MEPLVARTLCSERATTAKDDGFRRSRHAQSVGLPLLYAACLCTLAASTTIGNAPHRDGQAEMRPRRRITRRLVTEVGLIRRATRHDMLADGDGFRIQSVPRKLNPKGTISIGAFWMLCYVV